MTGIECTRWCRMYVCAGNMACCEDTTHNSWIPADYTRTDRISCKLMLRHTDRTDCCTVSYSLLSFFLGQEQLFMQLFLPLEINLRSGLIYYLAEHSTFVQWPRHVQTGKEQMLFSLDIYHVYYGMSWGPPYVFVSYIFCKWLSILDLEIHFAWYCDRSRIKK